MNCVALPVNWIHPAPSRFRGPPGNPTPPQDPHSIGSSTRSTLCQSAGMPLAHRGHGVYRTRSHGVSEVSRCVRGLTSLFSCLVHTSLHLALREHSQIHTNRRHATSFALQPPTFLTDTHFPFWCFPRFRGGGKRICRFRAPFRSAPGEEPSPRRNAVEKKGFGVRGGA